jgi:ribosomal protein S12 methylthiotransferase accessory factor YcaO
MPEPGGPDAEDQLAALRARMALVGSRLGVVADFDDDLLPQTPLRVTTLHVALGHGRRRRVAAVDVHNVAGARLAGLATAAGLYADRTVPLTGVLTGAASPDALPVVLPAQLPTHSGVDPEGKGVATWVRAASLLTSGRRVLVPAAAVAPYGNHNGRRTFVPGPAGTGVDPTRAGARGAALLSALAHDALVETLRGRRTATRLLLEEREDDPVLTFLVRTAAHLGVEPEVLDLGDDLPAPVVLVRGVDPRTGSAVWAVAADTTRRAATVAALRDVLGRVQLRAALPAGESLDLGDRLVTDLDPHTLVVSADRLWSDRAVTLPQALDRLRDRGIEPLLVDRAAPDLAAAGLFVSRVLLARRPARLDER